LKEREMGEEGRGGKRKGEIRARERRESYTQRATLVG
jgi:hypothetical protein